MINKRSQLLGRSREEELGKSPIRSPRVLHPWQPGNLCSGVFSHTPVRPKVVQSSELRAHEIAQPGTCRYGVGTGRRTTLWILRNPVRSSRVLEIDSRTPRLLAMPHTEFRVYRSVCPSALSAALSCLFFTRFPRRIDMVGNIANGTITDKSWADMDEPTRVPKKRKKKPKKERRKRHLCLHPCLVATFD
jgi:hypothetical protein